MLLTVLVLSLVAGGIIGLQWYLRKLKAENEPGWILQRLKVITKK